MKKAAYLARLTAVSLAVTLLAGCKILDDEVDAGFTGTGNEQVGGPASSAPTVWGDPETSVLVGAGYAFLPDAEDADGDVLEFSIRNKPGWASFDRNSGLLQGVPGSQHVGDYTNIVISVSDRNSVVSLPSFEIAVETVPSGGHEDDGVGSAPPTISGKPNTSVVAGKAYSFQPQATDPDGDALSFSIVNKPAWASFDTTGGRLQGTPTTGDVGTGSPIEISVTDGASVSALPRFTITVEPVGSVSKAISWTPPTENEDGTPLTDLSGYRIYYGTTSGDYSEVIELNSPGLTSYVIGDLAPGTYYLVMTSFNSQGRESRYTAELRFDLGS